MQKRSKQNWCGTLKSFKIYTRKVSKIKIKKSKPKPHLDAEDHEINKNHHGIVYTKSKSKLACS